MSDQLSKDVEEVGAYVLAHTALMTSMLGVLKNHGLVSQADINEIADLALVGLETADQPRPALFAEARKIVETFAGNMAGPRTA